MTRTPRARLRSGLALVAALLLPCAAPAAQGLLDALRGAEQAGEVPNEEPTLAERQADTAERLAALEERLEAARASAQEALVGQLESEKELLQRIELRQGQIEGALAEVERLQRALADARLERDAFLASDAAREVTTDFFLLEQARDVLDEARVQAATLENARLAAARQGRLADSALVAAEREERRAREAIARAEDVVEEAAARQRLRERELLTRAERELLRLRVLEEQQAELRVELQSLAVELARAEVDRLAELVTFSEEEFLQKSEALDARVVALRARRSVVMDSLQGFDEVEAEVRARVESEEAQESDTDRLERIRIERGLARDELDVVDRTLERVEQLRTAWDRRRRLYQGTVESSECAAWDAEAREWLEDLDIDEDARIGQLAALRDRVQRMQVANEERRNYFAEQVLAGLQSTIAVVEGAIQDIGATRRIVQRLRDEIAAESQRIPITERLEVVAEWIAYVWEYELIPLDDRPITVRKVVLGLTILVLGGWFGRRFSRLFGAWLGRRFGVDEGGLAVAQTLTFYVLVVVFGLLALKVVNVPLTAFTIFGGAIAIGVGFGSQNLINNFISGLILLMEQPVRVGDLINVGDLQGNVERIGARSTVVRTGSNIEIVVPNSAFLEQQVVNWTLSEQKVRVHVRVGVAYGSPTREVTRLMRRAVEEHGSVLKSPKPIVLFEDFGDNALVFEVHFWIRMRRVMDRRTIESDVRMILDGLFNEAGIVVAFPQRDVHLDTSQPLAVRIVQPQRAPEQEAVAAAAEAGPGDEGNREPRGSGGKA